MMSFQDFQLVFDLLARSHTAMARYILLATLEEADLDGITLKADDVMIMLPKNCPGEKHEVCKWGHLPRWRQAGCWRNCQLQKQGFPWFCEECASAHLPQVLLIFPHLWLIGINVFLLKTVSVFRAMIVLFMMMMAITLMKIRTMMMMMTTMTKRTMMTMRTTRTVMTNMTMMMTIPRADKLPTGWGIWLGVWA